MSRDRANSFDSNMADLATDALTAARDILTEAGERFVQTRRESRVKAYAELQETLMSHMGVLVPNTCSLKDFLSSNYDLEQFIKSDSGSQSLDPVEALERFLNGGETTTPPPVPDVEVVQ